MGKKELNQWNDFADDIVKKGKVNCFFFKYHGRLALYIG